MGRLEWYWLLGLLTLWSWNRVLAQTPEASVSIGEHQIGLDKGRDIPQVKHFPESIFVDASGGVYVAGYAEGASGNETLCGSRDAFVAKLTKTQFALYIAFGSVGEEQAKDVTIDPVSNTIYATGTTNGENLAVCGSAEMVSSETTRDTHIFIFKATNSETPRIFQLELDGDDAGYAITTGDESSFFIGGMMSGTGFKQADGEGIFVAKYTSQLHPEWSYQPEEDGSARDRVDRLVFEPSQDLLFVAAITFPLDGTEKNRASLMIIAMTSLTGSIQWKVEIPKQRDRSNQGVMGMSLDPDGSLYVLYSHGRNNDPLETYLDTYVSKVGSAGILLSSDRVDSPDFEYHRGFGINVTSGRRIQILSDALLKDPTEDERRGVEYCLGKPFDTLESAFVADPDGVLTPERFIRASYSEEAEFWAILHRNDVDDETLAITWSEYATLPDPLPARSGRKKVLKFNLEAKNFTRSIKDTTLGARQVTQHVIGAINVTLPLESITWDPTRPEESQEDLLGDVEIQCIGCNKDDTDSMEDALEASFADGTFGELVSATITGGDYKVDNEGIEVESDPTPSEVPTVNVPENQATNNNVGIAIALGVVLGFLAILIGVLLLVVIVRNRKPQPIYQGYADTSAPV